MKVHVGWLVLAVGATGLLASLALPRFRDQQPPIAHPDMPTHLQWDEWAPSPKRRGDPMLDLDALEVEAGTDKTLASAEVIMSSADGVLRMRAVDLWRFHVPDTDWECRIRAEPRPAVAGGSAYTWLARDCRADKSQASIMGTCAKYVADVRAERPEIASMKLGTKNRDGASLLLRCRGE